MFNRPVFRVLALAGGIAAFARADETLTLAGVLAQAKARNPDIVRARQSWKVAESAVAPAGAWPDPTFTYIDEKLPRETPGAPPMPMRHYRLEQMIPFPGKLSGDSQMKYHEAVMAGADYRTKTLDVLRDVRMRYYQLALTDQKMTLAAQSVELLRNTLKTAQARLAAGRSSAADVFMAETELRKMENTLFALQQERQVAAIELDSLLNWPTDRAAGRAAPIPLVDLPATLAELQALARRNAPQFINAEHEVRHSRIQLSRSRLAWAPDFGLMLERETAPEGGDAGRQIGLSVSFPLWVTRPLGDVRAAKEHVAEAQAEAQAMENMITKMVHEQFVTVQTHLGMARRVEQGVLPPAAGTLRVAREQYASGQADFIRMLEAFRTWIDAQNMYQDEIYQYGEAWTELGRWVGVDIDDATAALQRHQAMPMEERHGQ